MIFAKRWRATLAAPSFVAVLLMLALAWPAGLAHARKGPKALKLHGCWREVLTKLDKRKRRQPAYLTLNRKQGRFRWHKKSHGRFMARVGKVWLLDAKGGMGELWRFRFTQAKAGRNLILHKPETFRYLGRGRYLYFRFRSHRTKRRFVRLGPPARCPKPSRRTP